MSPGNKFVIDTAENYLRKETADRKRAERPKSGLRQEDTPSITNSTPCRVL